MKQFFTLPEAAEELGLSLITIKGAVSNKVLKSQRDPVNKRKSYITRSAIEAYRKYRALKKLVIK